MKTVAALAFATWAALFQLTQRPVLSGSNPQLSLDSACIPIGRLEGGVATQGGYRFRFESLRGEDCRSYRLANTSGQQSVKVSWRYASDKFEPILCETRLASCITGSSMCPAFECPKNEPAFQDTRTTELGYGGPNADSQTDHPQAYVAKRDVSAASPIRTILRGTAGDAEGKPLDIAIEVTSSVLGKGPYRLAYSIRTGVKSRPFTLWLPDAKSAPTELVVRWEAVESDQFFAAIRRGEAFRLSSDRQIVNVEVPAQAFERSSKPLLVMQGVDRVAAVSASAYIASK